ncbi:hypothetical protein LUZ61_019010 [Rhynchospora tenuis]|uniref:Bifunctional inhibitor/plant lipid transfer protein/seed storage helical domain-containing protein n=1 Tax=Rhynchospora tenuis TaxID=198213 RepID=A0AAD5ZAE1_9POAL|nr:hypothetical protein LUZ61_019010 [Rhynchospora tenuis]
MAMKTTVPATLFLALNIVFFSLSSACSYCPGPVTPSPRPYKPTPSTTPASSSGKCPVDALKLGVCANVLDLVKGVKVGLPPKEPCCPLLEGLIDLEAAVCLCTAIKANILGINLNIPVNLSLVLNFCGKGTPEGFKCA